MHDLLIASGNPGKLREMQAILQDLPIRLLTPADVGLFLNVTEDGESYVANARKKALAFCRASRLPTMADDSGLEVDVLGGAPGINSARYAPRSDASDGDRRAYLLEQLAEYPQPWTAHFRCTIVVVTLAGEESVHTGEWYGEVIPKERGHRGFGYDPIFLIPAIGKTVAEMEDTQKNKISHRALALQSARPALERIFSLTPGAE